MKAKKQKRLERHDALAAARASGEMVRFYTRVEWDYWNYGYVFGLTDDFALLQVVNKDVFLDGYSVFPISEVRGVEAASDAFLARALTLYGDAPSPPNGISLDDFPSLLSSADVHFPLIAVEVARKVPDRLFIGRIAGLKRRALLLREITPNAEWDEKPTLYRFKDITQVDFGGRYEAALWRVAQTDGGGVRKYRLSEG